VHELPIAADAKANSPRTLLEAIWSELPSTFPLPPFVGDAVQRALSENAPAVERALVFSHNDVHPANLIYDGKTLLLVDWDTSGPNDRFYDLAAIAVFLRMDDATCQKFLAAYDTRPISTLPARFNDTRRMAAILCGSTFLRKAWQSGHVGATGLETLENTLSLADFYQRLRAGELNPATPGGLWSFGLALVKVGAGLFEPRAAIDKPPLVDPPIAK
jgi:aminoglycoside phosphotransferase (APT) family kinase protein